MYSSSTSTTNHRFSQGTQKNRKQTKSSPSPKYGPRSRRDPGYTRHRRSRSRSGSPFPSSRRRDSFSSSVPEQTESPRNSKSSRDPHTSSLTDVSPNKSLQQPQSSTSSATIPRPISPKTQQQASSSSALQTGSLGGLSLSSTRSPITIPWEPKATRPNSPPRRVALRTGQPVPPTQPAPPLPMHPPQSLPAVPPAMSVGMAPSTTVEQTTEEKRAMWEERTQ